MHYRFLILFVTPLLFALANPVAGQTARGIVMKYLDTVSSGSVDSWDLIHTIYRESVGNYSQANFDQKPHFNRNGNPGYYRSYTVFPDKSKGELYADSAFTQLLMSTYCLKNKFVVMFPNQPPMIKPGIDSDEVYASLLPWQILRLLKKSNSVEALGIKRFSENSSCHEIAMRVQGRTYMLYINTSTFLLDYWNNRADEDLSIMDGFSDYRPVNGLLFPYREFKIHNSVVFYSATTTKLEINVNIPSEVFDYKR